jgi:hypothetical protein
MKRWGLVAGAVVLLVVAVIGWYVVREATESDEPSASSSNARPSVAPTRSAEPTPSREPSTAATSCSRSRPFTPGALVVRGVTDRRPVLTIPRDANGVPGVPPLTAAGKQEFAFDPEQGVLPGDPRGNVLLNAHTWPDGSGLGNQLLQGVRRGTMIVVTGEGQRLCYRVTSKVEVDATKPQPAYFATDGPPQLAIVVCSGERLGPGQWTKRTIWYAAPVSG